MERKHWVDGLKGLSMLIVLIAHTDIYYTGDMLWPYNATLMNALFAFFAMSGYLMYKGHSFSVTHKLKSILRGMVLPYFIFVTVIYVPKHLAHGESITPLAMLNNIVGGYESWFVTALVVAEILFSFVLYFGKCNSLFVVLSMIVGLLLSVLLDTQYNLSWPWHIDNALQSIFFLGVGYLFHQYENHLTWLNNRYAFLSLLLFTLTIKAIEFCIPDLHLIVWPIRVDSYALYLADFVVCTLFYIELFKRLPRCKPLEWVGQRSLVYYFLCGGVPLTISLLFQHLGWYYVGNWLYLPLVITLVCILASLLTYIIYRYLPFVVGKF